MDLCKQVPPAILFLMEMKAYSSKIVNLKRRLKFDEVFYVEANGLALFWNKKVHIQVMKVNLSFIHTIYAVN